MIDRRRFPSQQGRVDFRQDLPDTVDLFPSRVVRLEFRNIRDPPYVVAAPMDGIISDVHAAAGQLLAHADGFQHRTIGETAPAGIVDLAAARILVEVPEHVHEVESRRLY